MKKLIVCFLISCFSSIVFSVNTNLTSSAFFYKTSKNSDCEHWVDSIMKKLSLKEKIGQLFIYTIDPAINKTNVELLKKVISDYKIGGLLFSRGNLNSQAILTNQAQQWSHVPLFITFDGEWGLSMRLNGTPAFPKNMVLGCISNNQLIYEYGREVAHELHEIGVQINFAPDADVNINPDNPVINVRSFGESPEKVSNKVVAYACGLEDGGILSVCKHYPGHGDTNIDSHKALPILPFTRERLEKVELYPFKKAIKAGLNGIMVGHLVVPALENEKGLPASLSHKIIHDLLVEKEGFKGLIFTDALSMKGISGFKNPCLMALQAGNDMILAPTALRNEFSTIIKAVKEGKLSLTYINEKCKKVLTYKYRLGLKQKPQIQLSGLRQRINTPKAAELIKRLNIAAITVLDEKNKILPLPILPEDSVALLEVGRNGSTDALANQLSLYTKVSRFQLSPAPSMFTIKRQYATLSTYRQTIIAISTKDLEDYLPFFKFIQSKGHPVYLFFTPEKTIHQIKEAVANASTVILGHSPNVDVQCHVANLLYGKASADGKLSASVDDIYNIGDGINIIPQEPRFYKPENVGLSSNILKNIDSIANDGIRQGAFPGCQIVVMKSGKVIVDRCYGTLAGKESAPVHSSDLYDLASLSKTTGTLLAVMKLYDEGKINLTDNISKYLTFLQHTDKKDITISDLLFHQSGLPADISFYLEAIDNKSYKGDLFSAHKDYKHKLNLAPKCWVNPNFRFKTEYISPIKKENYTWNICDDLWLNTSFKNVIEKKIADAPMLSKQYRYSDVGFILLRFLVEQVSQIPMDTYLQQSFYKPMGLAHTYYNPLKNFPRAEIAPSDIDHFLRKNTLQGYVNDESAAFQGGVSGNAGLFSNARDVAQIYQMLINGGVYKGKEYLSRSTCRLFTTLKSLRSRRGLGFDRPDTKDPSKSPCAEIVPASVFGHTGFTGTCAWADPTNNMVFVFLSNRTYPDPTNWKLIKLNIRPEIQAIIYQAIKK